MQQLKYIIILLFSIGFCSATLGQNSEEEAKKVKGIKKTQIGIRSGLNYSFSAGNLFELIKARVGYHVGAYAQIPVNKKKFILEIGTFYSLEGFDNGVLYGTEIQNALNLPSIGNQALTRIHLDYLDFQFILKDNQSEKFSAFGGFEISYLLNSEVYQEYTDDSDVLHRYTSTGSEGLAKSSFGVILGLEYHVNHYLHINTQYTHPFTRFITDNKTDVKNSVFKLSVGFTF